jgi:hypothetical protein
MEKPLHRKPRTEEKRVLKKHRTEHWRNPTCNGCRNPTENPKKEFFSLFLQNFISQFSLSLFVEFLKGFSVFYI